LFAVGVFQELSCLEPAITRVRSVGFHLGEENGAVTMRNRYPTIPHINSSTSILAAQDTRLSMLPGAYKYWNDRGTEKYKFAAEAFRQIPPVSARRPQVPVRIQSRPSHAAILVPLWAYSSGRRENSFSAPVFRTDPHRKESFGCVLSVSLDWF
jgi:hypothetical protein